MFSTSLTVDDSISKLIRRVWGYQRGSQKPYVEEEQTTQWTKEKRERDKERSTKHTHTTKDRATRTQLKTGVKYTNKDYLVETVMVSNTSNINKTNNHL